MPAPRLALAYLFTLSCLVGCTNKEEGKGGPGGAEAGKMPPAEVEVITVGPRNVPQTMEVPGRLTAVRVAQVRARVEGILEKREYTEGSEVKAGQVLFRIDPRSLAADVASARANLAKAQAQALVAVQNQERARRLMEEKMVSQQAYDQAVAVRAQADAEVDAARAVLTRAELDLSYANVTAPISGRISRALLTEGALVRKDEATPLATIEQYDPIWVDFAQSSAEFIQLRAALKSGTSKASQSPVRLVLENGKEYPLPGRLLFNDLAVDPNTGSVGLRAEFPNPGRELLPGQFVTVRLPVAQAENVIAVPQKAVQVSPQGQMVMLVGPQGTAVPQTVKTGGLSGSDWIIVEGLKGGEQVIVNGVQKVRPGAPVKPVGSQQ